MMDDDDRKVVPEDLVFEVLKELPAKSLVRFRCVSKLWHSIIDDSNFVHSHRARSYSGLDATDLLLAEESYVPRVVSLYSVNPEEQSAPTLINRLTLHPPRAFQDLCYVNGLISFDNCIYNPSTRRTILLPPVMEDIRTGDLRSYYLGFDHSTKLYKVLTITFLNSKPRYISYVLTLGTNSWRNVGVPVSILPGRCYIIPKQMVYSNCANGVIFILTWDPLFRESPRLHAFEVGDEKFRVIALPQDFLSKSMLKYDPFHLLLAGDCPAVMIIHHGMMTIWILEDYVKQIWKREHIQYPRQWQQNGRIQFPQQWGRWPYGAIVTTPIGTIDKNKILFRSETEIAYADSQKTSFFYYDMQCKTSMTIPREVFFLLENRSRYNITEVAKHVETLFKLKEKGQ